MKGFLIHTIWRTFFYIEIRLRFYSSAIKTGRYCHCLVGNKDIYECFPQYCVSEYMNSILTLSVYNKPCEFTLFRRSKYFFLSYSFILQLPFGFVCFILGTRIASITVDHTSFIAKRKQKSSSQTST